MVMGTDEQTTTGTPETTPPVVQTPPAEAAPVAEPPVAQAPAPAAQPAPAVQPSAPAVIPASPFAPLIQNLPPEVQAYVTQLQDQTRAAQEQAELQQLNQATDQYAQLLVQRYQLTPEQAQLVAKEQGDIVYKQYQAAQLQKHQVRAAIALAKQHGVDPMQLLDLPNDAAMFQTAQALSDARKQAQENEQLKARVAALERGRIPAQSFAQGAQPGAGDANYIQQLKKGGPLPSSEEIDRFTARYIKR